MNGAQVGWLDSNLAHYDQGGRLDSPSLLAFAGLLIDHPLTDGDSDLAEMALRMQAVAMDYPNRTWRTDAVRSKVLEMYRD